jgi:metallo-beta-lactamase family protein
MKKKKIDKIKISFVGTNAESVTGSMTLIEFGDTKILLEAGLFQSNNTKKDYEINSRNFKFKIKDIDYIFINHCHIDHIGNLPRLYAQGCKAKIITVDNTTRLIDILLKDSAYIAEKDSEMLTRTSKCGKIYEPLYTTENVEVAMNNLYEYSLNNLYELDGNISFEFIPSQHIIHSAQLKLYIKYNNQIKKILYTSDLGNIQMDKPFVEKFEKETKANIVIGECTYADKERAIKQKDREKDLEKIKSVILNTCIDKKSKVLIPTFALDRTQMLLSILYDMFSKDENFDIPIIVDSPLACKITKMYSELLDGNELEQKRIKEILNWKNIKLIENPDESKANIGLDKPQVILSCSGMLTAGRSIKYCKSLLPNPNATILFCGYSSEGSLAWKIKNCSDQKRLTIESRPYKNKATIVNLHSFSGHMQYQDLINYYSQINCEKIYLVHSNFKDKLQFAKDLKEKIENENKTTTVHCVNKGTVANL